MFVRLAVRCDSFVFSLATLSHASSRLATLATVYVSCALSKFTLTKTLGGFFFGMYFAFVAYTLMHEFRLIPF